jgi:FAD/FMN-containing dehydrogenase
VREWHQLLDLPARLVGAGFLPSAFEFWDPAVLRDLREHASGDARRLPGEALALLEFDDPDCTQDAFAERLLEVLGPIGDQIEVARTAAQREALWRIRRTTSSHLKARFPHKISEDVVVPRTQLAAFFARCEALGLPMVSYGHLGDGNIHVNFLGAAALPPAERDAALNALFRLCLELGGTLSGEHGIGLAKRDAFIALSDPWQIDALRRIKQALDPDGIFTPGKVI